MIPGAQGRALRFVVYWKGGLEGSLQQLKVNLVLYENEVLQVTGSGYFLWSMDQYQAGDDVYFYVLVLNSYLEINSLFILRMNDDSQTLF